jgi:hypothetical protein
MEVRSGNARTQLLQIVHEFFIEACEGVHHRRVHRFARLQPLPYHTTPYAATVRQRLSRTSTA